MPPQGSLCAGPENLDRSYVVNENAHQPKLWETHKDKDERGGGRGMSQGSGRGEGEVVREGGERERELGRGVGERE